MNKAKRIIIFIVVIIAIIALIIIGYFITRIVMKSEAYYIGN